MFIRTRIIKGRPYVYLEERWREGKKVRSRSTLIKKPNVKAGPGELSGNILMIPALPFMMVHDLVSGKRLKELKADLAERNARPSKFQFSRRFDHIAQDKEREVDRIFGVDTSSLDAFTKSRAHLSPQQWVEYAKSRAGARTEYFRERERQRAAAPKSAKEKSAELAVKQFNEARAADKARAEAKAKESESASDKGAPVNKDA